MNSNTWLTMGFFGPVFLGLKSNSASGTGQGPETMLFVQTPNILDMKLSRTQPNTNTKIQLCDTMLRSAFD